MTNNDSVVASLTSGTAVSVTLAPRWSYILVENNSTNIATPVGVWVRTDGVAATVGGDNCYYVAPNGSKVVANMAGLWNQSAPLIQNGPSDWQDTDIYGGTANPGTSVSVILASGAVAQSVVISGAG